jgi:hypothetical protein
MSYGYANLAGQQSQTHLGPGSGGPPPPPGGFANPQDDPEMQYEDYYNTGGNVHPQAQHYPQPGSGLPSYNSYGNNSSNEQPPYLHPGYAHGQSYTSDYAGSNSNLGAPLRGGSPSSSSAHGSTPPLPVGAHGYPGLHPSDSGSGRDILQPVGPRLMSPAPGNSNNTNDATPNNAVHWVSADQHGRLGVPDPNSHMYPSYSGDTFTSNVNPFDAPMDQPLGGPPGTNNGGNEDIPLLEQHGRGGSGYSGVMLPGAMPAGQGIQGPGGFADPHAYHDDDDEQSQIRYGRIPQRVPRRLKTIKQGE